MNPAALISAISARTSPGGPARSGAARSSARLAVFMLALVALVTGAAAWAGPTTVRVVRNKSLPKNLLYWYALPGQTPSARKSLPAGGADGFVYLDVPAAYDKAGAQIKILDPQKGLLARIAVRDSRGRLAGNLLGPNLLLNSEFARDGEHWIQEFGGGQAKGQAEWLNASEMPKGVQGTPLRVRVLNIDQTNWHVQFHQRGLDLADNQPYTLTFWARADRVRPLSVNATVDTSDFHWIGLSNQVGLTTEWHKFTLIFTATRTMPNHNRLGFVLGDTVGTVDLAGVTLQRGVAAEPPGANLLRNNTFTRGAEGWSSSIVAPAKAEVKSPSEVPPPAGAPGKVAQVTVSDPGTANWNVQFFQTAIDLTEGEALTLTFWAKSDRPRPLNIISGEDKEDFHTVGLDNTVLLQTDWQKYNLVFTATRTVRNSHRLTFLMGDNKGEVDLAGVELRPGAEAIPVSGGPLETTLAPADFHYSPSVSVPVKYRGRPVEDLAVTLKCQDEGIAPAKLQPADRGVARFADVPVDEKITVVVSDGAQTAEFPRIVAPDAPGVLTEIEVPSGWTQVKTSRDPVADSMPFVGVWQSQSGPNSPRFITTINPDGTGTIRRVSPGASADVHISAPPSGAFLWHVKSGDHMIALGSRDYSWSITGDGKDAKLILKDAKGGAHILVRR